MVSLSFVQPILKLLPTIENPKQIPSVSERLLWTSIALFVFFSMYNILAFGIDPYKLRGSATDFLQVVTASRIGTLLSIGIGPIIMASIFLQLLNGAKLIDLDLTDKHQKEIFHGAQRILAILLSLFQATLFVNSYGANIILGAGDTPSPFDPLVGHEMGYALTKILVLLQIAFSSIILMYIDELISKYGIGSGISLFIAAGVSFSIVGGTIALLTAPESGVLAQLSMGGAEALPKALISLLPLFFTIFIFLIIVYVEGVKVNINIASTRYRLDGKPFSLRLLYVSNIPVILASAFFMNLNMGLRVFKDAFKDLQFIAVVDASGLRDGLLYLVSPIYRSSGMILHLFEQTPVFGFPQWLHAIGYICFLTILSIFFGFLWVEASGMGHEAVAEQLLRQDVMVKGFRRDKRIFEKILKKHIGPLTFLGSATVGLIAGFADLTGALGTGTGILLTVGIFYRFYEQLERYNFFESFTFLKDIGIK